MKFNECSIPDEPIYPTFREVVKANATERFIDVPGYNSYATEHGSNTKHTITGHFEVPSSQYHHYMETQQCLCVPNDGEIDIYSSTQWSDTTQIAVSEMLNVPMNTLNTFVKRVGGAFGGKTTRQAQVRFLKFVFFFTVI